MTTIADLSVVIGADIKDLTTKLSNAETGIDNFKTKASDAMTKVKNVGLPILGALGTLTVASAKAGIDFESNFANVAKTVNGTEAELESLKVALQTMATDTDLAALPNATAELTNIAAIAGQLGVETSQIAGFTEVIGGLTVATDMSGESAATFAARFANVTGMDMGNIGKLGNTLVELGNTSAAQESEIASMANRLASLGNIGFNPADILGYSAALASLGISAELGGTNTIKAVNSIIEASAVGGPELQAMADTAGLAVEEFQNLANTDIEGAFSAILEGLSTMNADDAILALQSMGFTGQEMSRVLTTLAGSQDFVAEKVDQANDTWDDSTALMDEVGAKADTTQGNLNETLNLLIDIATKVGTELLPPINDALTLLNDFVRDLDIEAGMAGWISAFHNFGRIVNIIIGDVMRRIQIMGLDIKTAALDAQIALNEALPEAIKDQNFIDDLKLEALHLTYDRLAFENLDRLNDHILEAIRDGTGISLDDLIDVAGDDQRSFQGMLTFFESNPEAISPLLKMNLADALAQAFSTGDNDTIGALIDLTQFMDFDPGEISGMLDEAMQIALDTQDVDLATYIYQAAIALDADVDLVTFNNELTALINAQSVSATVKASVTVHGTIKDFTLDHTNLKTGGEDQIVPRFHSGGMFNSGQGEGLALLRDGERVLSPEQTRAFDSGRVGGGVVINYSSFGETPYNALRKLRTAATDTGY